MSLKDYGYHSPRQIATAFRRGLIAMAISQTFFALMLLTEWLWPIAVWLPALVVAELLWARYLDMEKSARWWLFAAIAVPFLVWGLIRRNVQ